MKVKEITSYLEQVAPLAFQESYDNCGLQVGDPQAEATAALLCIDVTEAILEEAETVGANLIISHHPLLFTGIKKITPATPAGRIVQRAIRNSINIYSIHTNIDSAPGGVSIRMAEKMGLANIKVLDPVKDKLVKLVVFVPINYADAVRNALFASGAGHIGNYDSCSFNLSGRGSFRGNDLSQPFSGTPGTIHFEEEVRIETILPEYLTQKVIHSMIDAHPYEEVAYDLYPLNNPWPVTGFGAIGELTTPVLPDVFLREIKEVFGSQCIRHTQLPGHKIKKIALCGGSGSALIGKAINSGAEMFVTADLKYHQFFDFAPQITLVDIGHYESEQFTKELIFDCLTKKFTTFAVHFSKTSTNPIQYL